MEEFDIYSDILERTGGDVYVGVVGPVRTGKSTFITNFMQKLVMPRVENVNVRERMMDELPQSANGKTVMTTQPKFVPNEAVSISVSENCAVNVRLVDCVGYMVDGAGGHLDADGNPRMVKTPWSNEPIPFERAAEVGTRKVINEHATIGIVMTTDGTIDTEIARVNYVQAEERVIGELTAIGKPFVVLLNSKAPNSSETLKLASALSEKYKSAVIPIDVLNITEEDILNIFEKILMEFPLRDVEIGISRWVQALPYDNEIICELRKCVSCAAENMKKMSDYTLIEDCFVGSEFFDGAEITEVALGEGRVACKVLVKEGLFYKALSKECGYDISDEFALMAGVKELVYAKKQYDRLSEALECVRQTGYGVVKPSLDEMSLEEPEIVKQGSKFGVKLRASAPSLHIMQVDIDAEVSPIMGAEQQSEEMVKKMLGEFEGNPKGIWQTDMFGKSMHTLVNEGLNNKLSAMPEDAQKKMRKTLSRIVNEGKGGVICILI